MPLTHPQRKERCAKMEFTPISEDTRKVCETVYTDIISKAEKKEMSSLSDVELVSLLLGTQGKKDTHQVNEAVKMTENQNLLKNVARCHSIAELMMLYNITAKQATVILAAIEIGKRIAYAEPLVKEHISSPRDGAQYLMGKLRNETHEKFYLLLLDNKNKVMDEMQISEGSLTCAVVHPREVFAPAVTHHAAAILVAHNHPSGDPRPSDEDRELTRALVKSGELLGIPVLDHVVIGDGRYYSFKEHHEI